MDVSFAKPCVVCYDPRELEAILVALRDVTSEPFPAARSPLYRGKLAGVPISFVRLPFGDKIPNLEAAVSELFERCQPTVLLSAGTAMACSKDLAIGAIVLNRKAFCSGKSKTLSRFYLEELRRTLPGDLTIVEGESITSKFFVNSTEALAGLISEHPHASIVEMEDFHIARLAAKQKIPFLSFRAVSDYGDFKEHIQRISILVPDLIKVLEGILALGWQAFTLKELPNVSCRDLPFRLYIKAESGILTIPEAVNLARKVNGLFGLNRVMHENARIDLHLRKGNIHPDPRSPSGKAWIIESPHFQGCLDLDKNYLSLEISWEWLLGNGRVDINLEKTVRYSSVTRVPTLKPEEKNGSIPRAGKVHIQGLNSISAEAEEGLLACTTIEEFRARGYELADSDQAALWVYRTAHAANESYFHPDYLTPMRKTGNPAPGACLIATGLGPSIEPEALGGKEADILLLGDEQGGRLINYLTELGREPFGPTEVFRYRGVAQKISAGEVALSRLDRRLVLSDDGLNALSFTPETLRLVYSQEYDEFLRKYFNACTGCEKVLASYLFLTSRGCGNECSICCSGGYQRFSPMSPDLVADVLESIRSRHSPKEGDFIQIFFLDSNFNKSAGRVIALADTLEKRDLLKHFAFYVRHNGLQGFLAPSRKNGKSRVNTDLISAYQKLGIDEIVIGIDSYTETSIRLLKTGFSLLKTEKEDAKPSYTFNDIWAVIRAIEERGMKSRGFLLMNNPFTGDTDRLETFYNLFRLALQAPHFAIDFDSSTRVNDLKPFPGAPITRLAVLVPGLVAGEKFALHGGHGQIEAFLRFDLFNHRRTSPARTRNFIAAALEVRFGLGDFLYSRLKHLPAQKASESSDFIDAAAKFIEEEAYVQPLFDSLVPTVPLLADTENQIRALVEKLKTELNRFEKSRTPRRMPQERRFFELLETLTKQEEMQEKT